MEILSKLFGGKGIVKILRLFLFNPDEFYEQKNVVVKTRNDVEVVRSELKMLSKIGFIRKRTFYKEVQGDTSRRPSTQKGKRKAPVRKRVSGWVLDPGFVYIKELKALLVGTTPFETRDIVRRLRKIGGVKVIITTGVFVQHWESRLDILIVADNPKLQRIGNVLKEVEVELGREIRYSVFSTSDFKYRLGIHDKLVRDILDYPHHTVIDRIGIPS